MLNRCVVTVRAREPFLLWLQSLPDPTDITLDQANQDGTVYLLPDYEDDDEQSRLLAQYYDLIIEDQLAGWWIDQRDWPERRDLVMFTRWFDAEFHSVVIDLVDEALRDED